MVTRRIYLTRQAVSARATTVSSSNDAPMSIFQATVKPAVDNQRVCEKETGNRVSLSFRMPDSGDPGACLAGNGGGLFTLTGGSEVRASLMDAFVGRGPKRAVVVRDLSGVNANSQHVTVVG